MSWFNKKKSKVEKEKIISNLQIIPAEFYGAQDPVIHYNNESSQKMFKTKTIKMNDHNWGGILNIFKKKWVFYSFLGVIFVVIISLISWYYVEEAKKSLQPPVIEQPTKVKSQPKAEEPMVQKVETMVTSTIVTTTIVSTTEKKVEPEKPVSLQERTLEFPRILQTNSPDLDSDGLTDAEEELFNTASGIWDTDGDGYYDGQEVINLYNPKGIAPVKLIDSGLVKEYINPIWKYRVYYPTGWEIGVVDSHADQVLFSSATGDFVEISSFIKKEQETFEDWFARKAIGQKFSELQKFTNRFEENGEKRKDDLVAYFVQGNNIYILIYHPGTTGFIPFRHVMEIMYKSFRPSKTLIDIPNQTPLPIPPDFTKEENSTSTNIISTSTLKNFNTSTG